MECVCVRIRKYYVRVCRLELFMSYTFAIIVFIAPALEGGGWVGFSAEDTHRGITHGPWHYGRLCRVNAIFCRVNTPKSPIHIHAPLRSLATTTTTTTP